MTLTPKPMQLQIMGHMPACNLRLKWNDVLAIAWREPSYCCFDCKLFFMCILRDTDTQPYGRFLWQDQRKGWKSKGSVFWVSTIDSNLFRKENKAGLKTVSFSPVKVALLHPLSLLSTLQLTQPNLRIAHVCLLKPPLPSSGWSEAISSALPPFENNHQPGEGREKTPLASEIALSQKKESLLR